MTDRFDKFTEQAKKALILSDEEARLLIHNYIGTEHLLLGILRMEGSIAHAVLLELGITLNAARSSTEFVIGRGDRMVLGEIGLTPRAKKVIELAVDEARRLESSTIGAEHLLLALVRENQGIACGVIESLGVRTSTVLEKMLEKIRETQKPEVPPPEEGDASTTGPV